MKTIYFTIAFSISLLSTEAFCTSTSDIVGLPEGKDSAPILQSLPEDFNIGDYVDAFIDTCEDKHKKHYKAYAAKALKDPQFVAFARQHAQEAYVRVDAFLEKLSSEPFTLLHPNLEGQMRMIVTYKKNTMLWRLKTCGAPTSNVDRLCSEFEIHNSPIPTEREQSPLKDCEVGEYVNIFIQRYVEDNEKPLYKNFAARAQKNSRFRDLIKTHATKVLPQVGSVMKRTKYPELMAGLELAAGDIEIISSLPFWMEKDKVLAWIKMYGEKPSRVVALGEKFEPLSSANPKASRAMLSHEPKEETKS